MDALVQNIFFNNESKYFSGRHNRYFGYKGSTDNNAVHPHTQDLSSQLVMTTMRSLNVRHGAEQYAGDLECVFYGYHLDRAILKNAEAAYCLMPSLGRSNVCMNVMFYTRSANATDCTRV